MSGKCGTDLARLAACTGCRKPAECPARMLRLHWLCTLDSATQGPIARRKWAAIGARRMSPAVRRTAAVGHWHHEPVSQQGQALLESSGGKVPSLPWSQFTRTWDFRLHRPPRDRRESPRWKFDASPLAKSTVAASTTTTRRSTWAVFMAEWRCLGGRVFRNI